MIISLNKGLESYVQEKVASGNYKSSSEVVNEALLLLKEQDKKRQILLNEIQKGLDDVEAGRVSTQTPKEIFNEVVANRKAAQQH